MWISDPAIRRTQAAREYDPDIALSHVCSRGYNPRPDSSVSEPLKEEALREYGEPLSDASRVEGDHYFPRWLGGATTLANFWPEPNYAHASGYDRNPKDKLEYAVYRKVCDGQTMTVAEARRVFEGDWREAYRRYAGG